VGRCPTCAVRWHRAGFELAAVARTPEFNVCSHLRARTPEFNVCSHLRSQCSIWTAAPPPTWRRTACGSVSCCSGTIPPCHRAVRCRRRSPALTPFTSCHSGFSLSLAGLPSHTVLCLAATGQGIQRSGLLPQLRGRGHQEGREGDHPGPSLPEPCSLQDVHPPPRPFNTHGLVATAPYLSSPTHVSARL
jgi:hypothetical protein